MCEYLSFIIRLNVARSQVTKVAHLLQGKFQTGDSVLGRVRRRRRGRLCIIFHPPNQLFRWDESLVEMTSFLRIRTLPVCRHTATIRLLLTSDPCNTVSFLSRRRSGGDGLCGGDWPVNCDPESFQDVCVGGVFGQLGLLPKEKLAGACKKWMDGWTKVKNSTATTWLTCFAQLKTLKFCK